jgi:corrinoid protein of di/trimethylamine methyltransferase
MSDFAELSNAIIEGDLAQVIARTKEALANGSAPKDIIAKGLIPGMDVVGKRFKEGDMFIPEVLLSARTMHAGLDILKPLLLTSDSPSRGRVVLGTVQGDIHDVGKNLVAMMIEGAGFEVIDLGTDVPPEKFATVVRERGAQVVGLSALLTTTMTNMKSVIEALEDFGVRDKVKVLVGGAPVTATFAHQIGADSYAPDAARAVETVRRLMEITGEEAK